MNTDHCIFYLYIFIYFFGIVSTNVLLQLHFSVLYRENLPQLCFSSKIVVYFFFSYYFVAHRESVRFQKANQLVCLATTKPCPTICLENCFKQLTIIIYVAKVWLADVYFGVICYCRAARPILLCCVAEAGGDTAGRAPLSLSLSLSRVRLDCFPSPMIFLIKHLNIKRLPHSS